MQTLTYLLFGNSALAGVVYFLSSLFYKLSSGKRRCFLFALFSGGFGVLLYYLPMSGSFKLAIKLLLIALNTLCCFPDKSLRRSFLFLTVVYLLYFSFEGLSAFFKIGTLLAFLPALFVFFLVVGGCVMALNDTRVQKGALHAVQVLSVDGKWRDATALVDTGDLIRFRGKGVGVISAQLLKTLQAEAVGTVEVLTACEKRITTVFSLSVVIYSDGKKNIFNQAYFIGGEYLGKGGFEILLPPDYNKENEDAGKTVKDR